jgi:hypothetical protein
MKYSIAIALLLGSTSAVKLRKTDIRGPTTDGPTAGVYQWPTPAPAMAPTPGPFGPTKSLAQKGDIRAPSTDAPSKGHY